MIRAVISGLGGALLLAVPASALADPVQWWERLQSLCGEAYAGVETASAAGEESYGDAALRLHVRGCETDRVRIAFAVGSDLARTWVLTRHDDSLELRHEHYQLDGSPQAFSGYGGFTPNPGTETSQLFPADTRTHGLLRDAYPNVWMIQVEPGRRLVYVAQRVGTSRELRVEFDLSETIEPPPMPWGWQDGGP